MSLVLHGELTYKNVSNDLFCTQFGVSMFINVKFGVDKILILSRPKNDNIQVDHFWFSSDDGKLKSKWAKTVSNWSGSKS